MGRRHLKQVLQTFLQWYGYEKLDIRSPNQLEQKFFDKMQYVFWFWICIDMERPRPFLTTYWISLLSDRKLELTSLSVHNFHRILSFFALFYNIRRFSCEIQARKLDRTELKNWSELCTNVTKKTICSSCPEPTRNYQKYVYFYKFWKFSWLGNCVQNRLKSFKKLNHSSSEPQRNFQKFTQKLFYFSKFWSSFPFLWNLKFFLSNSEG